MKDQETIVKINWEPQERQLICLKACGLDRPFTEAELKPAIASIIGWGGAAGGGKTDTMVITALVACVVYPGINIGCFRRKYPQLLGLGGMIERSKQIYPRKLAEYNQTQHRWTFKNGSSIMYCHCQNPDDVQNYQSQQFDILMLDETTQFLEEQVKFLLTRNRATVDYPTFTPFALFATNPGGVSHSYFKREFVDIGPAENVHTYINETGEEETHYFIPAKVYDNQILLDRDPDYPKRLSSNPRIKRMLLDGDWEMAIGAEFSEFRRSKHVIKQIKPKLEYPRFLGTDWGYSGKPADKGAFATLVMAIIKTPCKDKHGEEKYFNRVVVYEEFYGKYKSPEEWARIIYDKLCGEKIQNAFCDPSMCNPANDGSISIAERMQNEWIKINKRFWHSYKMGTRNRVSRVACLHDWLRDGPDNFPYLIITENCQHLIRTLPLQMTDENNPSDISTEGEDHLTDALLYSLANIKFINMEVGVFGRKITRAGERINDFDPETGKQYALDLDKFYVSPKKKRDWRA